MTLDELKEMIVADPEQMKRKGRQGRHDEDHAESRGE